jgi:uncharacterized lipoprotein NlpE involved in copper resistance
MIVMAMAACSSNHSSRVTSPSAPAIGHHVVVTTARAGWRLKAPVSRLVALPQSGGALLAGGLDSSNASSSAVYRVDLTTGSLHFLGAMPSAFHDAAGAVIGGHAVVFGGGAASSFDLVQGFGGQGATHGHVIGHLPQPRSDLSAVTIGAHSYILGGYTGTTELSDVLATSNGTGFTKVATLPITVRYAAVAALGSTIWVIGGEHGSHAVRAIQRIDTTTGRASVVGNLPTPRSDATAAVVAGHLLVAGGRDSSGHAVPTVDQLDPANGTVKTVAQLRSPIADTASVVSGNTVYLIGGEVSTAPVASVQTVTVRSVPNQPATTASPVSSASASAAASRVTALSDQHPFNGRLLIADRGNNRLLVVNAQKQILWRFPTPSMPAPPTGFYFPDDAFFIHRGTGIISNQEGNDTIVEVGYPNGQPLWSYGHPKVARAGHGYLHEPDDAYLLRNGNVVVADANNCRVVIVSPQRHQIGQIGTSGSCVHQPPRSLGYPNGDTPLADGNILISEVYGSWISEYTTQGHLVWTVQLPSVAYPSDPQQIGPDRYLVADYAKPGGLVEFNRAGKILWSYHPSHGSGMLNHPSLAEVIPGGYICTNDDYRHRVVIVDPRTKRIIWQYGHTDHHGRRPGFLNIPDGFDLLEPNGTTPTHPFTG